MLKATSGEHLGSRAAEIARKTAVPFLGAIISMNSFADNHVASTTAKLIYGTDDLGGVVRNATVRVGECTGTLIASDIILTSGHCFQQNRTRPATVERFPHPCGDESTGDWEDPSEWIRFNPPRSVTVRFGHDSENWIHTATADRYSLPGCADIIMLRLTRPVASSVAVPVAVETSRRPDSFWRDKRLEMAGWGASGLDDLWQRPATDADQNWALIGHAHKVTGLASLNGALFAATEGNNFWTRPAGSRHVVWRKIGHAKNVVAMTSAAGKIFAATSDNNFWVRDPVPYEVDWQLIGHAKDVTAMAGAGNTLFAATKDNRLWMRPAVARDISWHHVGHAKDIVGMAAWDSMLYAATANGDLWMREASAADVIWRKIREMLIISMASQAHPATV